MMFKTLYSFLFGTLRGRLIIGVAAVHAMMMALFVGDLTMRQRAMLLDSQTEHAASQSQMLATSAAGWIAADDIAGLQELVDAQRRYPELIFAMFTDDQGRILADTDSSRLGLYLLDLPSEARKSMFSRTASLVDVATPAMVGGLHVGWARVGVSQKRDGENLARITRNGVVYGVAAIIIGSIIAWLMGRLITRRLYAVQETISSVRAGNCLARSAVAGNDEAAVLAREFNAMLDTVAKRDAELRDANERLLQELAERKRAQEEIHEQACMLEQEVAERQVAQEELQLKAVLLEDEINERMQAEEALRTSEAALREAQRVAQIGSWELDLCNNVLTWSDEVYRIFELDRDSFGASYKAFINAIHPDDLEKVDQAYTSSLKTREPYSITHRLLMSDGRIKYVHEQCESVFDIYDKPLRSRGTIQDVTKSTLAEHEVRRLKNYLANIIDSMPSMLVGMDRNEIVTQWNRQAAATTGIPAVEAIGRRIGEMIPDFFPWIEEMRDTVKQRRPASMENLLMEKDGTRSFYDLMLYPLIANGVEGAVVRIEDVTEQSRIRELMVQTEKMMSVGGLAAGMAHEINNPLGIIIQAAQNIERRVSPELAANRAVAVEEGVTMDSLNRYFRKRQIPEFIGSIREAAARASRIINNMLRFSRRADTIMQPARLEEVMEQALELAANDYDLKKKFDFRSITIVRDFAPQMPDVPMLATEIEQVLLNLLKNAAQSMIANPSERKPRIELRIGLEERYAVLEVEDNGPGMTEDVRRRVFEPFFTTKEPGIGTGLGLSVSYMIVTQNHKGLMEVVSTPGNGARFTVRLPLS